jgi:cis-L-3-hydroxyproline dehydratase
MALHLTNEDRAMLAGERGPAVRLAMSILTRMARVFGAPRLMDITAAHIDSTIYVGEAGLEFAERLAGLGAQVVVPTTLNVSGVDEHGWRDWAVPVEWAQKALRQMAAYESMGCTPIWTCAPYQSPRRPTFGQQIAWGESNAICYANSVLGARTERYPDLLDICCAITGRVPARGLHLTENRAGDILVRLNNVPVTAQQAASFFPVLGYFVGTLAQDRIPVIEGLRVPPTSDQLKALGAAAASSGAVALFHIIGVTPEAPTLTAAFQDSSPKETIDVTLRDLQQARRELSAPAADRAELDWVVVGCPHFSLAEFERLARLICGRRTHPKMHFLVMSSRTMVAQATAAGYLDTLAAFGGRVTVDTCMLASPMLPPGDRRLMTDSAKCAYYAPGMLGSRITFGSLADCVHSAVAGRVTREDSPWDR